MHSARWTKITAVLFSVYLVGMAGWAALRAPDAISTSERRPLATRPVLTWKDFLSGNFAEDFEAYALDQFPLRDPLRSFKAVTQFYLLQRLDKQGIYLADGHVAKLEYPLNSSSVQNAAQKFEAVLARLNLPQDSAVYAAVIPDKNFFLAAANGYPALDYAEMQALFRTELASAHHIDLFDCLSLEDYYNGDPHWRQERLSSVVERLSLRMGFADRLSTDYTEALLGPFYGAYHGQAALPLPSESLHYLTSPLLTQATAYHFENHSTRPLYDLDKAAGLDAYDLFLSGASALVTIENPAASTDRELLLFRDSFGSSLAPLLLEAYAKITLIDLRYIHPDLLVEQIRTANADVLFLYSSLLLNNSLSLR